MWPFTRMSRYTHRTRTNEQQEALISDLRRKIRNQRSQLKQLNVAILRKNHLLRRRGQAIESLEASILHNEITDILNPKDEEITVDMGAPSPSNGTSGHAPG